MSGAGPTIGGPPERPEVGLCARCRYARVQRSARGSRFWRCELAEHDDRFLRYPPLPVRSCPGFRPSPSGGGPEAAAPGRGDAEEC